MVRQLEDGPVDVHAHGVPAPFLEWLRSSDYPTLGTNSPEPRFRIGDFETLPVLTALVDLDDRLATMDRQGVAVQVLSPFADLMAYEVEAGEALEFSRAYNDAIAAEVERAPRRLLGMGTVPIQDGAAAAAELRRCVEDLGFVGVELGTRAPGRHLDDEDLDVVWGAADALRCIVLLHPRTPLREVDLDHLFLRHLVGRPAETTIAAGRLLMSGTLERHPHVEIVLSHGGGFLPFQIGRLGQGFARMAGSGDRVARTDPRESLARFAFDTILNDDVMLGALIERVGADRVVLGTDHPYGLGDTDPVTSVERVIAAGEQREHVLWGNVTAWVGRI